MKTTRSSRPRSRATSAPSVEPAVVEEIGERLRVRRSGDGAPRDVLDARLARIPGYTPTVGDRVVVSFGVDESYVIAVLHAAAPETLLLSDGARAEIDGGRLELRDADGRLLVRYEDGHAEIAAPAGDLRLTAPKGRVVIESALDVALKSGRDVRVETSRRFEVSAQADAGGSTLSLDPKRVSLSAPHVEVTSKSARLATSRATIFARTIATTAEQIAQKVVKYELTAERIVERTQDAFRDASGLAQMRVGRFRAIVKDVFSMNARRTVLLSKDETTIDGEKILLG